MKIETPNHCDKYSTKDKYVENKIVFKLKKMKL